LSCVLRQITDPVVVEFEPIQRQVPRCNDPQGRTCFRQPHGLHHADARAEVTAEGDVLGVPVAVMVLAGLLMVTLPLAWVVQRG
ncbi:MAG TPA: hypothetical protein ENI30_06815, partial [Gammaproteobacteria bacterium]|nr:hypothetical protein [Gammaproteobacteria bacterium]